MSRINYFGNEVPSILEATLHIDEQFTSIRRDILQPFDDPSEGDKDYYSLWMEAELGCRQRCEAHVDYWLETRSLRPLTHDDEIFFLCHRFDQASNYIQNLYLRDCSSIVDFGNRTDKEILQWFLVEWWNEHGSRLANCDDLISFEERYNKEKEA
jgi:hypothetical protein